MKVQSLKWVIAVALGGLLTMTNTSSAQNTNTTGRAQRRGPMIQQRVDRMTTELNLTTDQQSKVKALLEKQAKERREIFSDTSMPRDEQRQKMRALMEGENKELKTILTSEQFEKYQKLRAQMRGRRQGGPRQGQGEEGAAAPAPAPAPAPEPKTADK